MNHLPDYAELHCLSNFSFLRGASHAEELVARAMELDYTALAITDECSFAGSVRAHLAAKAAGMKLIHGTELRLADGMRLVLLAQNREGYGNLAALVTLGRRRAAKADYHLTRNDLAGWNGGGVPDCLCLWLAPPQPDDADARWLAMHFAGRAWIACERHLAADDAERLACWQALGARHGLPLVASGDVHMHVRSRRVVQDVLTALRLDTTVQAAGYALLPNGERHLRTRLQLARLYPPELLAETLKIAGRCRFSLDELRYEYPDEVVAAGHTPDSWLRQLTEEGLLRRYPHGVVDKVRDQIEHELRLIAELSYAPYFLTVQEIVAWAREQEILCQGRGSAANSAVCFALGITEVDPARANMLFERFVSKERNEPPDIDVDFEHERREEVIQHIYAKYGRERAALAASVICYRTRSALRDAGRALGFALEVIDSLTGNLAWWDQREEWPQRCAEAGIDPDSEAVRRWLAVAAALRGFPRHLSQHVGGFVIARGRLDRLVPIENAAMPERTVIQWDKDDIDALGLMKVDVLALGMLTALKRAFEMVPARADGRRLKDIADIPQEVPGVYDMLCKADSVGVFQVESRAQMSMLPRLKPRKFYDLVIEVAIVRPGPIQGGMVHPYLRRRNKEELESYPSEELREVLKRTLGVPLFQEQVMQIAIVAASYSPGEADQLRRSMAAWKRHGGLEPHKDRLAAGMKKKGYTPEFAAQIFEQIKGFGSYGFPESHAASFALLTYASCWLKCHEPAAFACALINSWPMGFYSPDQILQDARRHHLQIRPVDVRASDWDCSLEPIIGAQPAIRMGLRMIKGFREDDARRIEIARSKGAFIDIADLGERARLDARAQEQLADAGALRGLSGDRHRARWEVAGVQKQLGLFAGLPSQEEDAVVLPKPTVGEDLLADYNSLGTTLGPHPLALLRGELKARRCRSSRELLEVEHGRPVSVAGLVTGRQRPGTASGVTFVTLEDEFGNVNVVVWRDLADRQRQVLVGSQLLKVDGRWEKEGEVRHLIAGRLSDLSPLLDGIHVRSRDFH